MFLFSINASSERNRDRLCKTMRKIFHYKSRTSDCHVETNKSRVDINSSRLKIEFTLFKKLFDCDVCVKSEARALFFPGVAVD